MKGHGTHVAGTAAAITGNNVGVAGVAPNSRIMALKVFATNDSCSRGLLSNPFSAVPDAINHAVSRGAKVINLSLGTFQFPGGSLIGTIEAPCRNAFARACCA